MKLKNISIGDFIEAKNKHGGDAGFDVLEIGKSYEVLGFSESGELTVIISVPEHKTFCDGLYACHEFFRKPRPQPKQLDQSVFDGIDEKWKFAAVDQNAETNLFEEKPVISSCGNYWVNASGAFKRSVLHFDNSNWQNSLIERDIDKELTGSDLCRAMLARGDKYISGFGHHHSDALALQSKFADTVSKHTQCFQSSQNAWDYFVPINNQGEPLTASETGL